MKSKHITRDFTAHRKKTIRPTNYVKSEIISFNHKYTVSSWYKTRIFDTHNAVQTGWHTWVAYGSEDTINRFDIDLPYNVEEHGEYRFDVVYANAHGDTQLGILQVFNSEGKYFVDEHIVFDGDKEFEKRATTYRELPVGAYTVKYKIPANTLFLGIIVRKCEYYTGTKHGEDADYWIEEFSTNLTSNTAPTEISMKIPFDPKFVDNESPSGFVFDHRDEINIYFQDEDNELKQEFGGYISSVLPDDDKTNITITGANRLIDGSKRYCMEEMVLLGGDAETPEYFDDNVRDFHNHGEALEYLCGAFENSLNHNINENHLVAGETYTEGFTATLGTKGNLTNPLHQSCEILMAEQFLMLRNKADQKVQQILYLYNSNDYQNDPPKITDYPNFYITYGLGDPLTQNESTETITTETENPAPQGSGDTITAQNVKGLCGRCGYAPPTTHTWKNYCPMCKRNGSLVMHRSYSNGGSPTDDYEVSCRKAPIGTNSCGADFCPRCGNELNGSYRSKLTPSGESGSTTTTSTETKTTKETFGYDKAKPWQGYIDIRFAIEQGRDVKIYALPLDFTTISAHNDSFTGITPVLINNVVKQGMLEIRSKMAIIADVDEESTDFYLHEVRLVTAPLDSDQPLYTNDESNIDNSSCKMDFYGFGFRDSVLINPTNLQSCGKTLNSMIDTIVKESGYNVKMEYSKHRKDDTINFMVSNQLVPTITAKEGDDNNILDVTSINYTPISTLYNNSVYVYKKGTASGVQNYFTNTRNSESVLQYGELTTLESTSDLIEDRQAYYNARRNPNYNPKMKFSYTITLPGLLDVNIGDLVKCVMDIQPLNDIKKVMSIKKSFGRGLMPNAQTTLGLDEISPEFKIKKQMQKMREETRQESTVFSTTAEYSNDNDIYEWEY